jgi:hypothetical protein
LATDLKPRRAELGALVESYIRVVMSIEEIPAAVHWLAKIPSSISDGFVSAHGRTRAHLA